MQKIKEIKIQHVVIRCKQNQTNKGQTSQQGLPF